MSESSADSPKYIFRAADGAVPEEIQRLDALHRGITEFIGGLSFAPLDSSPPKAILEVGCALNPTFGPYSAH
ncbi:hypothetical protein NUW54_g4281 [Trametes sanguinea]|uniref:Uncharacterized protein n=1 Tax=Trametes sanguinea TaxID=158606 RepID=A0ACC1PZG2_9APHY|nr:hypothetical protein NUW54_g4281 [Trametes sanguinea]